MAARCGPAANQAHVRLAFQRKLCPKEATKSPPHQKTQILIRGCRLETRLLIPSGRAVRQPDALQLAVAPFGISSRKTSLPRTLKSASRAAQKSRICALAACAAVAQHNCRGDLLAELFVRHRKGDDLCDRRMVHQHLVHSRGEIFSPRDDDLFQPPGDADIAFRIHGP